MSLFDKRGRLKPKPGAIDKRAEDVTREEFDRVLEDILRNTTAASLLSIPGVYNCVANFFRDDVIEEIANGN